MLLGTMAAPTKCAKSKNDSVTATNTGPQMILGTTQRPEHNRDASVDGPNDSSSFDANRFD
jgi:hypothetical protein